MQAELPNIKGFEAASEHVTLESVAEQITCGPSVERHLATVKRFVDTGFDRIVLTQIGPEQDHFFEVFEKELAPALCQKAAKPRNTFAKALFRVRNRSHPE